MANKKESWKAITIQGKKPTVPYMISDEGRFGVLSENGKVTVRNFKPVAGNYRFNTRHNGKNKAIFLYKEVASAFLKKPSPKYTFIIHKDHDYLNDHVDNLKWATLKEHRAHTALSPRSVLSREKKAITQSTRSKVLSERSVMSLKKMIWDPKRKMTFKQLAEKFGVSEMQIYRIKNGEFWYHLRVENEPLHKKYKQNLTNIAFHEKQAAKTMRQIKDRPAKSIHQPMKQAKASFTAKQKK
jgi:hypothetical protein